MTPERYQKIRQVLDRRQPDLTVLTDQVHKPHNLSAIIRTCDAVGIGDIHCVSGSGRFRIPGGTAMGSQKWVNTHFHEDITAAIGARQDEGMQVVAAHLSASAVDFRAVDYTRPTALLLGAEKWGPSAAALAAVDQHITIPMLGMVASFNVSVAAAIILSEAQRQRLAAGCYDQVRLDAETYRRRLFEWGHPKLARYCLEHGLPYPPLDEEGMITDPHWREQPPGH